VELDADGLARGTHLLEGLGDPRWPAFALATLRVADPDARRKLPGARAPDAPPSPARVWARDHRVLIPYIGAPGSLSSISYVQALEGRHPRDAFRDRFVLVGVTATGMGDSLPTPVSGHERPMPGVEINANLLHVLRTGQELRLFPQSWRIVLSALLGGLPLLLYARLGPRYGFVAALGLLAAVVGFSALTLLLARTWFGPAPVIVTFVASYPIWSWLRLETAMRYLRQEMHRLRSAEAETPVAGRPKPEQAMDFLSQILPLGGWVLTDDAGRRVDGGGEEPAGRVPRVLPGQWLQSEDALWAMVAADGRAWRIGARWRAQRKLDAAEHALLTQILRALASRARRVPTDSVEIVEAQIIRLQEGQMRLRELHTVIDDSLAQMADAAVVTDNLGQVLVANDRAAEYLLQSPGTRLVGKTITELVAQVSLDDQALWNELFRRVLVFGESHVAGARHRSGRDLLVQLAPLAGGGDGNAGIIMNASDISALKDSERRRAEMLSFLSHDLRSPLVSVLAVLELARTGRATDDPLQQVEAYVRTTIDLAEQFVELVRAESQEQLRIEEVDLVSVATNALEQVWAQARAKSIHTETAFNVDEAWINGDGSLLERALVNLLSNAIRHNPEGTRVRLQVDRREDAIVVEVHDDGIGISDEDRQRLFRRFERIAAGGGRRAYGTGLGLAFVKIVAARHEGRVTVESRLGEGSVFTLSFPV
jgi:signal transduction histidine kinase